MGAVPLLCMVLLGAMPGEGFYLAGHGAEKAGRYTEGMDAFVDCARMGGPLEPYAEVRAAGCRSRGGDPEGALASLRTLVEDEPEGPWTAMARKEMAMVLLELKRPGQVANLLAKALDGGTELWWMDRYRWIGAEGLMTSPETRARGLEYFRIVAQTTRIRQKRLDAANFLAQSASPDDRIAAARAMLRSRAGNGTAKLVAALAPMVQEDPDLRVQWRILSARVRIAQGRAKEGRNLLRRIAREDPSSDWAGIARYHIGRSLIRSGLFDEAETVCDRLDRSHPEASETAELRWRLAEGLENKGRDRSAIAHFQVLAERFPDHDRAADALLRAGHLHRKHKRNAQAVDAYDLLVERYSGGGSGSASPQWAEGAYWAGRLLAEEDLPAALERFRTSVRLGFGTYFGHRAQERLVALSGTGSKGGAKLDGTGARGDAKLDGNRAASLVLPIQRDGPAPRNVAEDIAEDVRFERMYFFGGHGLEEAEWEALALAAQLDNPSSPGIFYQAMGECGVAYTAMQLAAANHWEKGEGGASAVGARSIERLRVSYPRAYWPYVLELGEATGVDAYLILAVARQESTFRPALRSSAGAEGVMQVMPATAKWLVNAEKAAGLELAAGLDKPRDSLRLGAYYLKRMLERSQGNLVYALASYNAGPGNCDKWRRRFRTADMDAFIEAIPFSETRGYVKKVLGYYAAYQSLYPPALGGE